MVVWRLLSKVPLMEWLFYSRHRPSFGRYGFGL